MEMTIPVAKWVFLNASQLIPAVSEMSIRVLIVVHTVENNVKITKLLTTKKKYNLLVT